MKSRSNAIRWTIVVALITTLGPMLLAVFVAQRQGLALEFERALGYAREVQYRSDRAVEQMRNAVASLQGAGFEEACSEEMLDAFLVAGLEMRFLIAVGYVEGNTLHCSTLGLHEGGFDLGEVDLVSRNGSLVRMNIEFPFLENAEIMAFQRGNYVAIAHREQAVDVSVEEQGAVMGTFTPGIEGYRTVRGELPVAWIDRLGDQQEVVFADRGYIVAAVRSREFNASGAVVGIPRRFLNERVLEFAIFLLPIGILTAIILTFTVLYLARQQLSAAAELRMALRRREFYLVYQPIVELDTGRWVGAEALLRWRRGDLDVAPDVFISAAEKSGLITRVTEEVMALAEQDMGVLMREYPQLGLSINLSAADVQAPDTLKKLRRLQSAFGGKTGRLTVELTERVLVDPESARSYVAEIRRCGVRVAIDDFGTGYSSLSYLETMQFDTLKIDKLFVDAIGTDAATNRVVLHIIEMGRTLGLTIVAEGVETQVQADFLKGQGVHLAQGWHFGYPQEVAAFAVALRGATGPQAMSTQQEKS